MRSAAGTAGASTQAIGRVLAEGTPARRSTMLRSRSRTMGNEPSEVCPVVARYWPSGDRAHPLPRLTNTSSMRKFATPSMGIRRTSAPLASMISKARVRMS